MHSVFRYHILSVTPYFFSYSPQRFWVFIIVPIFHSLDMRSRTQSSLDCQEQRDILQTHASLSWEDDYLLDFRLVPFRKTS